MRPKLQLVLSFTILLSCFYLNAQESYWVPAAAERGKIESLNRELNPDKARYYNLNGNALYQKLSQQSGRNGRGVLIYFPDEIGELQPYMVKESSVFAPELAAKYPGIKSYIGYSTEQEGDRIRLSWSHRGLQAMLVHSDRSQTSYIQRTSETGDKYVVYSSGQSNKEAAGFVCYTETALAKENEGLVARSLTDDLQLNRFRIAVSATGEYTEFHGGTVDDALAAINATITRVNEVMETDLGVQLQVIANNDEVIFLDPDTDPYNGDLSAQVQQTLTSIIGEANYDVGHLFHLDNDSGFAGFIGAVCQDNQKGSGFSQALTPQGDFYDIDYVSHELGHQFGANHTWSFNTEGTGVQAEPASGTTIMAYAGIVAGNNVQSNSDDYFHYNSILQITNYLATTSCSEVITTGNNTPVISSTGDFTIPRSTAFVLEGNATDPDGGDVLTYCWEQIDDGIITTGNFGPDNFLGANFRSLPPSTDPARYFPRLSEVAQGNLTQTTPPLNSAWESVSDIQREMNFALTLRDNASGGGQVASDLVRINVVDEAGPFTVTSQTTAETVSAGDPLTVTWDVANTNAAPVNAQYVDVYLSTDGGLTFPERLLQGTPNDGSAEVLIPGLSTSEARLMVKANENIFFAVNSSNFTIVESSIVLQFEQLEYEVCQPDNLVVPFVYETYSGFSEVATFSALNVPTGLGVSFNPTTAVNNDTPISINLTNTGAVSAGSYPITIRASAGNTTKDVFLNVVVLNTAFGTVVLNTPADGATDVSAGITLNWEEDASATSYDVEIATDIAFSSIVETSTTLLTSYQPNSLQPTSTYYWRVRPFNSCGAGAFSNVFSFTTIDINCSVFDGTGLPIPISVTDPQTITSVITVVDDLQVSDVNVALNISHTWVSDLVITLESPAGTVVPLTSNSCGDLVDIDAVFDDEGAAFTCSTTGSGISGTIRPLGSLARFNGESTSGDWILTVADQFPADGGALNNFSLEICGEGVFRPDADGDGVFDEFDQCPNTPTGAEVDVDGCEVFRFAQDNFTVSSESESCIGSNDGNIIIEAEAALNYSVVISGPGTDVSDTFTDRFELNDISGGIYTICLNATDGSNEYEEICFDITIEEPAPLSVSSVVATDGTSVFLSLSGSDVYNIELNGKSIQTTQNEISLDLKGGSNSLKVSTLQSCQGTYEEEFVNSSEVLVYPNPFVEYAFVNIGLLDGPTQISVYGTDGRLLIEQTQDAGNAESMLDFSGLPSGIYFVRLENQQMTKTFKIIKR
ncbi:MAG: reprolysin-like metallopeptidase [Flavobacteriaceae bacterium]